MNSTTEVNHEKLMELFGNVFNDVAGSMAIMMYIWETKLVLIGLWIN